METSDAKHTHEFNIFQMFFIWVGAADRTILKNCPLRDVHNVITIGALLLIVWVWQAVLFTMVGHMMLARHGEWRWEVVTGGLLLATVVMVVDSYVIVRSSWHLQGLSELKRGGIDIEEPRGAKIKNGIFVAVRLLLSTVLAMLTALFLSILLFEKDILANLEQHHQKLNAPILARLNAQADEGIAKLRFEHEEIRKGLATLAEEERQFRSAALDPAGDNSEFKAALDRLEALNKAKAAAQEEVKAAQDLAADELAGKPMPGLSGKAGYGPLRRAADEKIASAKGKLDNAAKEVVEAEKRIEQLRESYKEVTGTKRQSAENKLADMAAQRKEREERLRAVENTLRKRETDRDASVRKALEGDPAYKSKEDGFLARLEGLERISEPFHVKFVVTILHIGLFGIELAAVLAKIATFIPSSYTTVLAFNDMKICVEVAGRLNQEIRKILRGFPEDPEDGAPTSPTTPPSPPPAPAPASEPAPEKEKDIVTALREMFDSHHADEEQEHADPPPHHDTAHRKRTGKPGRKNWKPRLRGDHDNGQVPGHP